MHTHHDSPTPLNPGRQQAVSRAREGTHHTWRVVVEPAVEIPFSDTVE